MTVNLDLRPEISAQLREAAKARGLTVEEYLSRLIKEAVPMHRSEAALCLLDAWEEEDATEDGAEIEKRRNEWTSFKAAMNKGHSSDRILFP